MGSSRKVRAWACLEGCGWDRMALGSLRTEWRSLDGFWAQTEVTGGGLDKFKWSHEDVNGPGWTRAA